MSQTSPEAKNILVDFEPVGRRAEIMPDQTLLDAAQLAGVELVSICGGLGSCGDCRVRLMSGTLSPPSLVEQLAFDREELLQGVRLACQAVPLTDVKVHVPPESLATSQRLQIEGEESITLGGSTVIAIDLQLAEPTLDDLRSDLTRLRRALPEAGQGALRFAPRLLGAISDVLRSNRWRVRAAVRNGEVVALLPPAVPLAGLAVDIGTTKVAAYLLDLETGRTLAKAGIMNPQIGYGEDVISRIAYADAHEGGRAVLRRVLVDALNEMVGGLASESGLKLDQIVEAVMVGNTAMHHLFAGLPVHQLGLAPYVPAVSEALDLHAADLGLAIAPGAHAYLPPSIAGFVGGDHVAMLLSTRLWQTDRTAIGLDIGTNTEITLVHGGRLLTCSCASGPALEGAHIRDGMRAVAGAIERVQIVDGMPRILTVGGAKPVGICGSGILDVVAELIRNGSLDHRGSLREGGRRVRRNERTGLLEYVLALAAESGHGRDLVVTRSDVNEIQLAKAAIRAGTEILLREAGIPASRIEDFVVAGAFGTYLDVESAKRVGLFPDLPRERFRQVGNAAGMGARQLLVSQDSRMAAEEIRARVEYVELTTHPGFTDAFLAALPFGAWDG